MAAGMENVELLGLNSVKSGMNNKERRFLSAGSGMMDSGVRGDGAD